MYLYYSLLILLSTYTTLRSLLSTLLTCTSLISSPTFSLISPLMISQKFAELHERVVMQRLQRCLPPPPSIQLSMSSSHGVIQRFRFQRGSNVQCSTCNNTENWPNDCQVACFMNEFQIRLLPRRSRGVARRGGNQATTYSRMQNTIYYKGKSCRQHDGN